MSKHACSSPKGKVNRKSTTPKGKSRIKEMWKEDEETPGVVNLVSGLGDVDEEVNIIDNILTARVCPHGYVH